MIGILEGGGMQWIKQGKLQWAAWSLFFSLTALYPITCVLAPVLYNSAVRPIAAALGMQKKNEGITLLRPWAKNSCKVVKGNEFFLFFFPIAPSFQCFLPTKESSMKVLTMIIES